MPRLLPPLALACALTLLVVPRPLHAAPAPSASVKHVMVQLQGQPLAANPNLKTVMPGPFHGPRLDASLPASRFYASALTTYQDQEVRYLRAQGIDLQVRRQFHILFNGFDAVIPGAELTHLRQLRNVAAVLPVRRYRPLLDRSLPLIHVPEAWSQLGGAANAGKGMMIADIDSGIDISNPCFSDKGFAASPYGRRSDTKANLALTNNKVIVAKAFGASGQTYSAADTVGHGTFTAAIEACDYNTQTPLGTAISGVAPAAYLGNYNIFPGGAQQTSQDDPVIPALEQALLDGADVINMSFGTPLVEDPKLDADSQAVSLAIKAGAVVVVAAGNGGPANQTISSPASDPAAIAVASTSNARGLYSSVTVDGPGAVPANLAHIEAAEGTYSWSNTVGPAKVVDVGLGRRPGDDPENPNANDFSGKDLHGAIALIERGNGSSKSPLLFETKIRNAMTAGAVGAIVYDNQPDLNLIVMGQGAASLPAMFISQSDGKLLSDWVHSHPDATVTLNSALSSFEKTPNVLSDFSARGYGAGFEIKPDLAAPGQDIYSATESGVPNNVMYNSTGFTIQNGTSFSAPHVTGTAALLREKHPTWTPGMVKAALMDTAGTDVYLAPDKQAKPSVMQVGAGIVDVGAAISSTAYLSPASVSFGEANVGTGPVTRTAHVALHNVSGSTGQWTVTVDSLHGGTGVSVSAPSSVTLTGDQVDVPITLTAQPSAQNGDYDGYILFQNGSQTIHLTYFVHVVSLAVKPGSVLLVDATASRYDGNSGPDYSKWYEQALRADGRSYTYWNEGPLGPATAADMKRASAVIVFSGGNFNGLASADTEHLAGPLGPADVSAIHSYLDSGGRVFLSGMGIPLSDPTWSGIVLGAVPDSLSLYDTDKNDKKHSGGVSPPRPSAVVDSRTKVVENRFIFGNLKPIDFSTKGDGAHDNVAVYSGALDSEVGSGLLGVNGLLPVNGQIDKNTYAYGQAALRTTKLGLAGQGADVGVVSSDEPSFKHQASYAGRSVLFSFNFEGINDNTGYATRAQVLSRILDWFADGPAVTATPRSYAAGRTVQLQARVVKGASVARYQWQVGSHTLASTSRPTLYRFPRRGRFSVRVLITDALGHRALSRWTTVTVR